MDRIYYILLMMSIAYLISGCNNSESDIHSSKSKNKYHTTTIRNDSMIISFESSFEDLKLLGNQITTIEIDTKTLINKHYENQIDTIYSYQNLVDTLIFIAAGNKHIPCLIELNTRGLKLGDITIGDSTNIIDNKYLLDYDTTKVILSGSEGINEYLLLIANGRVINLKYESDYID